MESRKQIIPVVVGVTGHRQLRPEDRKALYESVIAELRAQGLSDGGWDFLEPHAFAVQERIEIPEIRAMHIMEG